MAHKEYIRHVAHSKMAVLMLHGIIGTPDHFKPFLPLIPGDFSIYNILLDGHGQTIQEFNHSSMQKWKDQVQDRLDYIFAHHEKVMIVAHSMGTLFAIDAAIRYPDRVVQLFCHGIPMVVHVPAATHVGAWRVILGKVKPGTMSERMRNDTSIRMTRRLWQYLPAAPRYIELLMEIRRVRALLPQLTVPCRSYLGATDELVSLKSNKYLENHPSITHTVLPLSGHFCFHERELPQVQAEFPKLISK